LKKFRGDRKKCKDGQKKNNHQFQKQQQAEKTQVELAAQAKLVDCPAPEKKTTHELLEDYNRNNNTDAEFV